MEFDQTFTTNGLRGKDERIKFWGQVVKGQGHGMVKYAQKCTWPCQHDVLSVSFLSHVGEGMIVDRVVATI